MPTVAKVPTFISSSPSPVTTSTFLSGLDNASPRPIAVAPPIAPAMVKMLSPSFVRCAISLEAPANPHTIKRSLGSPTIAGTAVFLSSDLSSLIVHLSILYYFKTALRRLVFG